MSIEKPDVAHISTTHTEGRTLKDIVADIDWEKNNAGILLVFDNDDPADRTRLTSVVHDISPDQVVQLMMACLGQIVEEEKRNEEE
jgi:hypothetical protein